MAKVTEKLQVTIPKELADRLGIRPGDEVTWESAGDALRLRAAHRRPSDDRGWRREDLYTRGDPR